MAASAGVGVDASAATSGVEVGAGTSGVGAVPDPATGVDTIAVSPSAASALLTVFVSCADCHSSQLLEAPLFDVLCSHSHPKNRASTDLTSWFTQNNFLLWGQLQLATKMHYCSQIFPKPRAESVIPVLKYLDPLASQMSSRNVGSWHSGLLCRRFLEFILRFGGILIYFHIIPE